jgi:hypothetical protein
MYTEIPPLFLLRHCRLRQIVPPKSLQHFPRAQDVNTQELNETKVYLRLKLYKPTGYSSFMQKNTPKTDKPHATDTISPISPQLANLFPGFLFLFFSFFNAERECSDER